MVPRGVGLGWLCVAVLCSGAVPALDLKEEEPGHQSATRRDDVLKPTGDPPTITRDMDKLTTWTMVTPTAPLTEGPATTPMLTQVDTAGKKTQNSSAVPIRYWSPVIFVVVALLVLFFTYRWTKMEGSQDQAASTSNSSDLGALDDLPIQDTTPIIPTAQEERKGPEKPPDLEHTETTFCEPDSPSPQLLPPQPDTPTAAGGPCSSGEPSAN